MTIKAIHSPNKATSIKIVAKIEMVKTAGNQNFAPK
jgi:hypothetical protein